MVILCLIVGKTAIWFSKQLALLVYIPTRSIILLIRPHPHQQFLLSNFYSSHLRTCKQYLIVVLIFDTHFHDDKWYGVSFHVLIFHFHIFIGESSIQILCQFLTCYSYFSYWLIRDLYKFGYKSLSNMWFPNIFFHYVGCLFMVL